jgi:hypothetical protein
MAGHSRAQPVPPQSGANSTVNQTLAFISGWSNLNEVRSGFTLAACLEHACLNRGCHLPASAGKHTLPGLYWGLNFAGPAWRCMAKWECASRTVSPHAVGQVSIAVVQRYLPPVRAIGGPPRHRRKPPLVMKTPDPSRGWGASPDRPFIWCLRRAGLGSRCCWSSPPGTTGAPAPSTLVWSCRATCRGETCAWPRSLSAARYMQLGLPTALLCEVCSVCSLSNRTCSGGEQCQGPTARLGAARATAGSRISPPMALVARYGLLTPAAPVLHRRPAKS